jgi:hypothetical protein
VDAGCGLRGAGPGAGAGGAANAGVLAIEMTRVNTSPHDLFIANDLIPSRESKRTSAGSQRKEISWFGV